jgi:hypothetical protein
VVLMCSQQRCRFALLIAPALRVMWDKVACGERGRAKPQVKPPSPTLFSATATLTLSHPSPAYPAVTPNPGHLEARGTVIPSYVNTP